MKTRITPLLIATSLALTAPVTHADGVAHSLNHARSALDTKEARSAYDEAMGNTPERDGFGTRLPAGFDEQFVIAQLAPGQDAARAVLVGVKPWPQRAGAYVAIVCLASSAEEVKNRLRFQQATECEGDALGKDEGEPDSVWLGVFQRGPDGAIQLVARTQRPLDEETDWSGTPIDQPEYLSDGTRKALPNQWLRFDLAPYLLRAGDYALGVRAGWSIMYSGGGAQFEALYLFRIDGDKLKLVFARPMMYFSDIAGDWHRDGTRDHEMTDGSVTLSVLNTSTAGFRDWQLRQRGGSWRQTFHWSAADGEYVPH